MLYKDFFQYFFRVTVNYTRDDFFITRIADQVENKEWGICRLKIPQDTEMAFMSIYQMNQKFFDANENFDE